MKSLLDIFRRKKHVVTQPAPYDPNFIPSIEDVAGVEVNETIHPSTEPFPLPRMEGDIWIVFGGESELKSDTRINIRMLLLRKGYTLRLFKEVFHDITEEKLAFNFPGSDLSIDMFTEEKFNGAICKGLGIGIGERDILFIRYVREEGFAVYNPEATNDRDFLISAYAYGESLKDKKNDVPRFSKTDKGDDNEGPLYRKGEPNKLHEEVQDGDNKSPDTDLDNNEGFQKVKDLVLSGYSIDVIASWLGHLAVPRKLYISDTFRIHLDDKNGPEVVMRELPKTLFLFFLWNDREYYPYQMADHQEELLAIYKKIVRHDSEEAMKESIESLATDNDSFMQKRNGIKKAFEITVSPWIMKFYTIQGEQNYAKRIIIDRSIVIWEKPLFPNGQ